MSELKYKDCVGTTTNGERVVNYTDSQILSKKDKDMLKIKSEDEYATYEEYNDIVKISMHLNDENKKLQKKLDWVKMNVENNIRQLKEFCFALDKLDNKTILEQILYPILNILEKVSDGNE